MTEDKGHLQTSMSNGDLEAMAMVLADFYYYTSAQGVDPEAYKVKQTGNVIEFMYKAVDEYDGKYILTFEDKAAADLWLALARNMSKAMCEKFHVPGVLVKYEPSK